jgi:predicted ATPase
MLTALAISGYRSLRDLLIPLRNLNLITGANGSGKTSLYRALRLLADTAQGNVVQSLAREGGLQSTLWAGPEEISRSMKRGDHPIQGTVRTAPISLRLGFGSDEFGYLIDLGLPSSGGMFGLDPEIKRECIWHGDRLRPSNTLVDRRGPVVRLRRQDGDWEIVVQNLSSFDSVMTRLADPRNAPEVLALRDSVRDWRFYDHFRMDAAAPARSPQIGTRTPVLGHDGGDLGPAIQTIFEIGDAERLSDAVVDAFPGSQLWVQNENGRFALKMKQQGLLRPLDAAELSDGTLRYLLWVAALLTPRPPALMVLNEPETSLHPDLFPALARLIARAAERSQLIVVSHAPLLIEQMTKQSACYSIRLVKEFGETGFSGGAAPENFGWHWPSR